MVILVAKVKGRKKGQHCLVELTLPDSERVLLQQAQHACRGQAGYVPVTVLLMLDQGHATATVAQALGVDVSSVYRYAQTYQLQGLAGYLRAEQSGYWGLLTSAQLAGLRRELDQALYTDCRAITDWLAATYGVRYSVSGLTDLLHRLGFSYKRTTAMPCQADAAVQTAFLTDTLAPLLVQAAAGEAGVYFADAVHSHPRHPRHPRLDLNGQRTAPAHGQRPRAGQPQRGPRRPLPHPGLPRQDRLRQRPKHPTALRETVNRPPRRAGARRLRQCPLLQK